MAELRVIKRVILPVEAPEVTAHVTQRDKVGILGELELLLEVNDLLARLNLQQLGLGYLDGDTVAIGARDVELLVKDLNDSLDLKRQLSMNVLIDRRCVAHCCRAIFCSDWLFARVVMARLLIIGLLFEPTDRFLRCYLVYFAFTVLASLRLVLTRMVPARVTILAQPATEIDFRIGVAFIGCISKEFLSISLDDAVLRLLTHLWFILLHAIELLEVAAHDLFLIGLVVHGKLLLLCYDFLKLPGQLGRILLHLLILLFHSPPILLLFRIKNKL